MKVNKLIIYIIYCIIYIIFMRFTCDLGLWMVDWAIDVPLEHSWGGREENVEGGKLLGTKGKDAGSLLALNSSSEVSSNESYHGFNS